MKGEIKNVFDSMNKAVNLEPKNPQMWINLSYLYGNSGNIQKAEECIKKANSLK